MNDNATTRWPGARPRVVVAVPSTGRIHNACMESIRAMMRATTAAEEVAFWWGNDQPHDRCRNAILDRFVSDARWSHLLFLDTDVQVEPDTIDRLLAHDVPIVCAPVPTLHKRYGPPAKPSGITVGTNIMTFDDPALRGGIVAPDEPHAGYRRLDLDDLPDQPFTCDATGLGLCLIRREVIERVDRPWCAFVGQFHDEVVGEDVYFFRQARQAGFSILVDPDLACDHLKDIDLTHLDVLFTDEPPVSPWPSRQTPAMPDGVLVAVCVPRTGWLDIHLVDVLGEWEKLYGERVLIERLFCDTIRGGFVQLSKRLETLARKYTHVLFLGSDSIPHPATLGLMGAVDAPIVSALTRSVIDGRICWSFWTTDPDTGRLAAPQNISLPELTMPFEVAAVDPACLLLQRDALGYVTEAMAGVDNGPDADREFAHAWCNAVTEATGRLPMQVPLTVERHAEIGLKGLLDLKMRLKARLRESLDPELIETT